MKPLKIFIAFAVLLVSAVCSGSTKEPQHNMEKGKTLIVFFSHAGENYAVGNIEVGNTKIVADYIQEQTGADVFEIVAEKNYDMPYSELIKVARGEKENHELPPFKGAVENIDRYDTVFIGGPIWWGTYPQVMFTFFKRYDLNGKTLIPFTTHEGSGLGSTVKDVKKQYPEATVTAPFPSTATR
ncbi:flavodoxin [Phocaeicola abscessus]|uniref:flavodoxin n=1 Tax=Phocaeicola abscessus TaxID=555313 RepID=UPI0028E40067|nr:flavodoxin [Phocaeicola abscessus]